MVLIVLAQVCEGLDYSIHLSLLLAFQYLLLIT